MDGTIPTDLINIDGYEWISKNGNRSGVVLASSLKIQ